MSDAIHHTQMISSALSGFRKAIKEAQQPAEALSRGEVTPDSVVQLKLASQNIRVQKVNLKSAMEIDKHIIDLLA